MNRTGSLLFVAFIVFLVVAAVYTTTALALRPANSARNGATTTTLAPASVTGKVVWGQLVVLAPEARISVRLLDVSNASGGEVILGSYVLIVADGGYPAEFEIPYDPSTIDRAGYTRWLGISWLTTRSFSRATYERRSSPGVLRMRCIYFCQRLAPGRPLSSPSAAGNSHASRTRCPTAEVRPDTVHNCPYRVIASRAFRSARGESAVLFADAGEFRGPGK